MQGDPAKKIRPIFEGGTGMTAVVIVVAVLAANYLFTRWDSRCMEEEKRLADFNRVESKRCYAAADTVWMSQI